jgi:hypothetical protein
MRHHALSTERRFNTYLKMLPAHTRKEKETGVLRLEWTDAVPYRLREKHDGLTSEWKLANREHQERLSKLMYRWIIHDNEPQQEIEDRLRFMHRWPGERCGGVASDGGRATLTDDK